MYDATRKEGRWKSWRLWDGVLAIFSERPLISFIGNRREMRTEARLQGNNLKYIMQHSLHQYGGSNT